MTKPTPRLPVLVGLDPQGVITMVGESAALLWQRGAESLIGIPFVSLFSLEVFAHHPDRIGAQWELLLSAALNGKVLCATKIPQDQPIEVSVAIEESRGATSGYFAWVEKPSPPKEDSGPLLLDSGLALLAEHGAVGFFDLNFRGSQVYYSPAWKRLLGYSDTEIVNTYDSWLRLIHPDDSGAAPDQVARHPTKGVRSFSVEIRMLHRGGHYIWVQCLGTQVFGAGGELERVTGLQIDISERKEIEEETLANEERFQRLATEGALAAFDLDFARQEFWFSPTFQRLFRASEDNFLKGFQTALLPADSSENLSTFFLGLTPAEPTFAEVVTLRISEDRLVPALLSGFRQLSRKRELTRVVGFCCPLPETFKVVPDGPIPPALLSDTLASLSEAIVVADEQGKIIYLNAKAERLTGSELKAVRERPMTDVFQLVNRSNGKPAEDPIGRALASTTRDALLSEHALVSAHGGIARHIVWSIREVWRADGQVAGFVLVFRDPHEMNLTPEELLKANRLESLGTIAGGIAHDFNNLLTTILGGISQAKDNSDPSYLGDSERACLAAKALTKQLLAAAKGGDSGATQTVSVGELLRDAMRLARAGAAADIKLVAPETVALIHVDRSQILQVFQNLIINALQALPAYGGKIWLQAANTTLEENSSPPLPAGDYVEIEVKDNGSGIAPEHLERVFEPFFTTKKNGTGIGLPTVLSIVRKHGGQVKVESTVGQGTVFRILLPKATQAAEPPEARRAPLLRFGTGRVLLMDDDPDICRLASGMLASLDYKYDAARNGEEAIALYRRYLNIGRPYDLVILDLTVIGGMGGEETFLQLRELDPNIRAIVCSGYDSEEMAKHYLDMGLCGYLTKPFRLGDLGKMLKTVLG